MITNNNVRVLVMMCKCKIVEESDYNLADVHAGVAAEGPDCSQIIGLYQSRDNAILVHFSYHCCIHKVHQAILIQCNTCMKVNNSKLVHKTHIKTCYKWHETCMTTTKWSVFRPGVKPE